MPKLTIMRQYLHESSIEVPGDLYDRLVADDTPEKLQQARGELAELVGKQDFNLLDAEPDGIIVVDPASDQEIASSD